MRIKAGGPDTLVSSLWVFSFERYSLRCLFDLLNSGMLDLAKSNSLVVKTASRKPVINLIINSRIPTVKLKIPGKAFLKSGSRTTGFFFTFFHGCRLTKSQPLPLVDS